MPFILAITPILLILSLMLGLHWGSARAGAAGYLCALLIATTAYGAGPQLLAYAHAKALLLSLDVLLIIWAAFLLYRVADEAGAIRTIGLALPRLTPDPVLQALVIGWVFASFLQGIGGFGVPVAVTAPILAGLGFSPMAAVLMSSAGHAWGITFGSMGTAFQALVSTTGQPDWLLTRPAAIYLGVAGLGGGVIVAQIAGGWKAVARLAPVILTLGVGMGCVHYIVAVYGPWNLSVLTAGMAGLLLAIPLIRLAAKPAQPESASESSRPPFNWVSLMIALSCYAILTGVALIARLIPPVRQLLGLVTLRTSFPQMSTSLGYVTQAEPGRPLSVLSHTGALLFYAAVLGYLVYRKAGWYEPGAERRILISTLRRVAQPTVSIASMVSMAMVMEHAGMTDVLARSLAENLGAFFPLVAPWIGVVGAFITGSNTNSNVIFGVMQMNAARWLGFSIAAILGGQTAGAALATVVSPTIAILGTSTTGMIGREGEVMRRLMVYMGILILLVSLMTALAVRIAWPG